MPWRFRVRPGFGLFPSTSEAAVNVGDDALRAEIDALRAENEALRAQSDPARRVWTASELGSMGHEEYVAHEREVLAALREGRVRRDDAPRADPDGVPPR
jgi:hypothetical protein